MCAESAPKVAGMATAWRHVFLVYVIGVLSAAQLGVVAPLLPTLRTELGMSLTAAGATVSIITLVGAVLGLPAGGWSQALGHTRTLLVGAAIMAISALLCAIARDTQVLMIARVAAGVGYLLAVVTGPSLMAMHAAPPHQPLALALWGTFVPVGISLAAAAAGSLSTIAGWRATMALDAGVLALAFVVGWLFLPRTTATASSRHRANLALLRAAAPISLAFFCFALSFLALAGLLPTYLVERRGLAPTTAGQIAGIVTLGGIAGSLAAGLMMARGWRPAGLIAIGLGASSLLAALVVGGTAPLPFVVTGFVLSFALGGLVPAASFASVPVIAGDLRAIGPVNGLLAQAGSLGSLAGPPVLAAWIDLAGWSSAPWLLLAIAAAGSACALAGRRA
jgi:predicted MFS family arabinose efflux permease